MDRSRLWRDTASSGLHGKGRVLIVYWTHPLWPVCRRKAACRSPMAVQCVIAKEFARIAGRKVIKSMESVGWHSRALPPARIIAGSVTHFRAYLGVLKHVDLASVLALIGKSERHTPPEAPACRPPGWLCCGRSQVEILARTRHKVAHLPRSCGGRTRLP